MKKIISIFFVLLLSGCGSVISTGVLKDVDRNITMLSVQADPASYEGSHVLWGGRIVNSKNLKDSTVIEVFEMPLSYMDIPDTLVSSRGRFIIKSPGFLDTLVYKADIFITVAGVVKGVETKKIGDMDYPYPVIAPIEMRLVEPYSDEEIYYDRYDPWYYDPWWDLPYYPSPNYPYPYRDPWPYRRGHRHYP